MTDQATTTPTNRERRSSLIRVTLPGTKFHRVRKSVRLICVTIFILLPLFDVIRFDLPRQRFYFFGAELWISEFAILFLTMMFLWVLVAAMAMIYGRFYCGYLCPQMIFSEAANALELRINRLVNRKVSNLSILGRKIFARAFFYAVLLPASVFVTFVFISFFIPPADLLHRLLSLDIRSAGGVLGASVTLLTFLDFAILRQRFCTAICPYGYLQSMLADKHTLLVHFSESEAACIHCGKCVRSCPMGIDIRRSSHQLECTHCAECIDACSGVLSRLGRKSVIQYAWGDAAPGAIDESRWYLRLVLCDGKRIAVLVVLLLYATGLSIAIGMRQPVLVRIMPDRITLYNVDQDGAIHNRFRVVSSNRGKTGATIRLSLVDLPSARIAGVDNGIILNPGETLEREFDVVAARQSVNPGVNHLRILAQVVPVQKEQSFAETFLAPIEDGSGK